MKRLALVVLAACGNGSQGADAGLDTSLRPDGNMDMDLDGIKDDVDNCPASTNAGQGNEDGDKFGDACDPCPPIADDNPANADGDAVADACDPVPGMFGDTIKFFEGFHSGVPQGWDKVGTWTAGTGALVGTSTTQPASFAILATDRTRDTVWIDVSIDSVSGAPGSVGVLDNKTTGTTSAVACVITSTPELSVFDTNNPGAATATAYQMTVGGKYLIKLRRDMNNYTCTADRGGTTASVTRTITLTNTPYLSGITLSGAVVRVHYFMVVESL